MTTAMLITMVLGFALSVSVAVSIGLAAITGMQIVNAPMLISVKEMFNAINKFPLAAIPFFILAGNLMETGGISQRLVNFAESLVGGIQGGPGVAVDVLGLCGITGGRHVQRAGHRGQPD